MQSAGMKPKKPLLSLPQAAPRDVESGYKQRARSEANAALKLAANRDVEGIAGPALARAGYLAATEKVAVEVIHEGEKRFPWK